MSNPSSRSHGQVVKGPSGPGLALFFGFVGYLAWHIVDNNRYLKKLEHNKNEFIRRGNDITQRNKELLRQARARDKTYKG